MIARSLKKAWSYVGWMRAGAKRRKSATFTLAFAALLTTTILCVQYNASQEFSAAPARLHVSPEEAKMPGNHGGNKGGAPYVPKRRLVHLDLKGAPPKVDFLKTFFKLVAEFGATGILLEWEDMFPWRDNLASLAAGNAYTVKDVKEILAAARENKLDVIPLVQTFGHLEFALKGAEFAHLREVPESPQALCPSFKASIDFVQDMIDQIVLSHRGITHLHIGCDEVFNLGECARCKKTPQDDLFLSHVRLVAEYVRRKHNITPIIWDDMLRHVPTSSLLQYNIGKLVQPMVWVYAEDVYRFVQGPVWDRYSTIFETVWAASAFKGAFGETHFVPNAKRHLENNLNWLEVMSAQHPRFSKGFMGIVITGWQRYDHFAVLCETLPASVPCLAMNLIAVSHGYANASLNAALFKGLECGPSSGAFVRSQRAGGGENAQGGGSFLAVYEDPFMWDLFARCSFPGHEVYRLLYRLKILRGEFKEFIKSRTESKGWLTDYNVRHNFSSPLRVKELTQDEVPRYHQNLLGLVEAFSAAMKEAFDHHTIEEWIEQNLYPMITEVEALERTGDTLKSFKTWPNRPLPTDPQVTRLLRQMGN